MNPYMSQDILFPNYLFRLRCNRRMGQKRLAYLVGVSVRAISDYEHGRRLPPLRVAMQLELVLSARVSEIYVNLSHGLTQQVVSREDALPGGAGHEIRNRMLRKD